MFNEFKKLGTKAKRDLLLYPFTIIFIIPKEFILGSLNLKLVLKYGNRNCLGFYPDNALNNLFYLTEWMNLKKFGRSGISPLLGLGSFELKTWFFLSRLSLGIFVNAGALTTYSATLLWVLSFVSWHAYCDKLWLFSVLVVLLLSVHSFAMAFVRQNYQLISWILVMPMCFFAYQGSLFLFFISVLFVAETGITAFVLFIPVIMIFSINLGSLEILIIYALGSLPIVYRMRFFLKGGDLRFIFEDVAKLIGAKSSGVNYSRELPKWDFATVYFTLLYFTSFCILSFHNGEFQLLLFVGLLAYLINQKVVRIADEESLMMFNVSLLTLTTIQISPTPINLIMYWLVVNPIPFLLGVQSFDKMNGTSAVRKPVPFDHTDHINGVSAFLKDIDPSDKILCVFKDPIGKYSNLFDGYRIIHEVTLNVAARLQVHCMPDWWAVAQTNYAGAPQIWGASLEDVRRNCLKWECNHAILYIAGEESIDAKWLDHFQVIKVYEWGHVVQLPDQHQLWSHSVKAPKLILIKLKSS